MRKYLLFFLAPLIAECPWLAFSRDPGLGYWVCPDTARREAIASCPGLLTGKLEDSLGVVIGAMGRMDTLPIAHLTGLGASGLTGQLQGVTDDMYAPVHHYLGTRLGDEGNPYSQVGLLVSGENGMDTLEFREAGAFLGPPPGGCDEARPFDVCLAEYPGYGLIHPPLLPDWSRSLRIHSGWVADEARKYRPMRNSKPNAQRQVTLFYQARPGHSGQPRFFETGPGNWVFGIGNRLLALSLVPDSAQRISSSQQDFFVREVVFHSLPSGGWTLAIVKTGGIYSDGDFQDLFLVTLPSSLDTLHLVSNSFTGSSGESGGSMVEGSWWKSVEPGGRTMIYIATAQEGNETGENRDLRIAAYEISRAGNIAPVRKKAFKTVLFGDAGPWSSADSLANAIMKQVRLADAYGMKPLPYLVGGQMQWFAGAVLPDSRAAKASVSWGPRAKIRTVPAMGIP